MKIRHSSRLYVYLASKTSSSRASALKHSQTDTHTHSLATYRALRLARFHVFGFISHLCAHQPPALSSIQFFFRNLLLWTCSLSLSLHFNSIATMFLLQVTVISVVVIIVIMYSFVENSSQTENLFAYRVRAIKTKRRRRRKKRSQHQHQEWIRRTRKLLDLVTTWAMKKEEKEANQFTFKIENGTLAHSRTHTQTHQLWFICFVCQRLDIYRDVQNETIYKDTHNVFVNYTKNKSHFRAFCRSKINHPVSFSVCASGTIKGYMHTHNTLFYLLVFAI